jgi:hypothetical protein
LTLEIPRDEWGKFLQTFSRYHQGWLIQLETHDLVTAEKVVSQETPLQSIELDLKDEKNPRINVIVQLDNKVIMRSKSEEAKAKREANYEGKSPATFF